MLRTVPDLAAPEALVGRVALHLARRGAAGLADALTALVDGAGLRSAVLRRADVDAELLATAGEVVQAVQPRRRAGGPGLDLTVRTPDGRPLAVLTVAGARPQVLPVLREVACVLGLALAGPALDSPATEVSSGTLADIEGERAALADLLHDGPLQELVAARYAADTAVRAGADPQLRSAVQGALVALRRVVWQLRPRGADGLGDALDRLSAQLTERGLPALRLLIDPAADVLPRDACLAAYRLVQAVVGPSYGLVLPSSPSSSTGPVTVRLVRQGAPGGRQVVALQIDGAAPLADHARWRRTAEALGGDLLSCTSRLRLVLPAPAAPASLVPPAPQAVLPPAPTPKAVP